MGWAGGTGGNGLAWQNGPAGNGPVNFDRAFSLTTVPEPATLALLGLAFAGLGFSRRKQ